MTDRLADDDKPICWCDGPTSCHNEPDGNRDGWCAECRSFGHGSMFTQSDELRIFALTQWADFYQTEKVI